MRNFYIRKIAFFYTKINNQYPYKLITNSIKVLLITKTILHHYKRKTPFSIDTKGNFTQLASIMRTTATTTQQYNGNNNNNNAKGRTRAMLDRLALAIMHIVQCARATVLCETRGPFYFSRVKFKFGASLESQLRCGDCERMKDFVEYKVSCFVMRKQ